MKLNRKTRIIGLSAILAVILVGVGVLSWKLLVPNDKNPYSSTTDGTAAGKIYVETLLNENTYEMSDVLRYGDTIVARTATDGKQVFVDVNTWETVVEWPADWAEKQLTVPVVAFDDDKNLYGAVFSEDTKEVSILKHHTGEKQQDETTLLKDFRGRTEDSVNLRKLMVDSEYFYLQSENANGKYILQIFTHGGEMFKEYGPVEDFDIDGTGSVYILHETDVYTPISRIEVKIDKVIYNIKATQRTGTVIGGNLFLERDSEILCLELGSSVLTYSAENGLFINNIMDKTKSAPSLSIRPIGMAVDSEFNIFIVDYVDTAKFYKYSLTDDLRRDMPYTLTVTAPYRDGYFEKVIAEFERQNPEEKVKYDYAYNDKIEFGMNGNNDGYFDKMAIRLMTGDVGDVVMAGQVYNDIYHLTISGVFADLKSLIAKDPSYKDLDKKMLDGITINEDIGALPLAATHRFMQVNETLCQEMGIDLDWNNVTWGEILDLAEKFEGTDKYLFSKFGDYSTFVRMNISNMPDLINLETGELDLRQPWFLELIEKWKTASKNPNFQKATPQTFMPSDTLINTEWKTEEWDGDMADSGVIRARENFNSDLRQYPLPSGEKNTNRSSWSEDMYSISASSKNTEGAWKLLSLAMSEEMQSLFDLRNRPLNLISREKNIKDAEELNVQRLPEMAPQFKTFYEDMRNVYSKVDYMYDMGIGKEHLFFPLLDYVNDKITLDEALEKAEHDLWIWLNE